MMDINIVDVTIHIDENLPDERRPQLIEKMRAQEGVVAVGYHDEKPHLMVVEYNPQKTNSSQLLEAIKGEGLHAELIGL